MREHFPELVGGLAAMQAWTARLSNGGRKGIYNLPISSPVLLQPCFKQLGRSTPKSQAFDCYYTEQLSFCNSSCLPISVFNSHCH